MNERQLKLASATIIEAVVDIDCDMPNQTDIEALDAEAAAALAASYPTLRRRILRAVGQLCRQQRPAGLRLVRPHSLN